MKLKVSKAKSVRERINALKPKKEVPAEKVDMLVMSRLIAILKLERELSDNMKMFGYDVQIYLTDYTRSMSPDLREKFYKIIDSL